MKIIDTRDHTCMEGELVATLAANEPISALDMLRFYRMRPGMKNFEMLAKAIPQDRLVLRRGDTEDEHFYIVPRYPFYKPQE